MALDLETLSTDMRAHLEKVGMPVFHGYHQSLSDNHEVDWDTEQHPDFREFVATAQKAGAKLMVFHQLRFQLDTLDEALDHLETSDLTRDEKRHFESRLKQLQGYEGFTCALQLSFTCDGFLYLYQTQTDWYVSLQALLAELEAATNFDEDDDSGNESGPIGSYYSNN